MVIFLRSGQRGQALHIFGNDIARAIDDVIMADVEAVVYSLGLEVVDAVYSLVGADGRDPEAFVADILRARAGYG